jgi:hypothetical protein
MMRVARAARGARTSTVPLAATLAVLAACGGTRRLDEAVFHDGPGFRLKLVRYYENLPFHFQGEVFRVQCASPATASSPAGKMQDAGWVTVGNGAAIGSRSAAEVVERVRGDYLVLGERTLAWIGNGVNVSFDACGTFRGWYPTSLPSELLVPGARQEFRFDAITASPSGHVSFVVRSDALKKNSGVGVESRDFGQSWTVSPQP